MNDLRRWAAQDIDECTAGIARAEEWAAHYEAEAERVAFAPDAQAAMLYWANWYRDAAEYGYERLPTLRKRLADFGG